MKHRKLILAAILSGAILLASVVIPFVITELFTAAYGDAFHRETYDVVGEPMPVYDCKVMEYVSKQSAKVLYVVGDCEIAFLHTYKWDSETEAWVAEEFGKWVWTTWGGSAGEFYWPPYYIDKMSM